MTRYTPAYKGTVTRYVFVESPTTTPADLAVRAYEVAGGAMVKETCFGLQITGKEEDIERIVGTLREMDPPHIFVKDRGFPPGDPRRCRANLGGARPGFFGHEFEIGLIKHVSHGIEALPSRPEGQVPHPPEPEQPSRLDTEQLRRIIRSQEP